MVDCLQKLGYDVKPDWPNAKIIFPYQKRTKIPAKADDLYVANSGTTIRFLAAMLDGRARLRGGRIAP